MRYQVDVEGKIFEIEVDGDGQVWINNQPVDVDLKDIGSHSLYSLLVDHRSFDAQISKEDNEVVNVSIAGRTYATSLHNNQVKPSNKSADHHVNGLIEIKTPLPGWLMEIRVSVDQLVRSGDVVAVMESMKMHIELRTQQAGKVKLVNPRSCGEVERGEILAIIDTSVN